METTYSIKYDLSDLSGIMQDYGQTELDSITSTGSTVSTGSTGSTGSSRSSSRASVISPNELTCNSNNVKIHYISANKLFKYSKYDENFVVECSICLNAIRKNSMIVKMGCGHYFHKACLFNWIDISKKTFCPNCRYDEF